MIDFANWLQREMDRRRMTQADLARASGLSTAAISRIISGVRRVGPSACRAIARALNLPEESVFRRAGLLSDRPEIDDVALAEWIHLWRMATPEERESMVELARVLSGRAKRSKQAG